MSEKFKFLKITLFTSIILAVIVILSFVVDPSQTSVGTDKFDKVVYEVNEEKENSIDVVVLGDSEAYRSVSPLEIYRDYGFTVFVGASPVQKAYQSLDMLKVILERQQPKICILETNLLFRNYSAVSALIPKFERTFPIFKYHNIWKSIFDSDYSYDEIAGSGFKGYRYSDVVKPTSAKYYMSPTNDTMKIKSENTRYFKKIYDLCKENDIELILISTPSTKNWTYAKHNAVKKLSANNDLKYIDLNLEDSIGIDWRKDTYDRGDHMNYNGARKVTAYLGEYLNRKFDLPDHRDDDNYSSWDSMLEIYLKMVG